MKRTINERFGLVFRKLMDDVPSWAENIFKQRKQEINWKPAEYLFKRMYQLVMARPNHSQFELLPYLFRFFRSKDNISLFQASSVQRFRFSFVQNKTLLCNSHVYIDSMWIVNTLCINNNFDIYIPCDKNERLSCDQLDKNENMNMFVGCRHERRPKNLGDG